MKAVAWSVELGAPLGSSADTLLLTHTRPLIHTLFSCPRGARPNLPLADTA